jgi:hypothetical protein
MIGQRQLIVLGVSLSLMGGAFAYGVHKGTVWEVQRNVEKKQELQEEILDLNLTLNEKNAEILRLNREREGLIHELETQAVEADGAGNPGVAATGGLRRLEQRWGPSPTSSD